MSQLQLNRMPEPTWRWLKVNTVEEEEGFAYPVMPERIANSTPDGVWTGRVSRQSLKEETGIGDLFAAKNKPLLEGMFAHRTEDVWCVRIADESNVSSVIDLDLLLPEQDGYTDEVVILAGRNSRANVRLAYRGDMDGKLQSNVWIVAGAGASVTYMQANLTEEQTKMFGHVYAWAGEGASLFLYSAQMGKADVTDGLHVVLEGQGSSLDARLMYVGTNDKTLDLTSYVEHRGKDTQALVTAKGILDGNCKKTFRDTLDFIKGSSKSKGREEESVLMLSPHVKNISVPLLYCGEDDVEGEHAASCGRPDEGILYYFMSRGISEEEAKKMMARSSFASLLTEMPDPDLKEDIMQAITHVLFGEKEVG